MNKKQLLEQVEELGSSVEKGQRFLEVCLEELYPDDRDLIVIDGSGDGGIDAFKFENQVSIGFEDVDRLLIVQSKYGESFSGIDTIHSELGKILSNFENESFKGKANIFESGRKFIKCPDRSRRAQVKIQFITSRPLNPAERKVLESWERRMSDSLKTEVIIESLDLDYIFSGRVEIGDYKIKILGSVPSPDSKCLVCIMSTKDLYKLYDSVYQKTGNDKVLFFKNMRQYLGGNKDVNKTIKESFIKDPAGFGLRNNGIKLVTDGFEFDKESNLVVLHSPSVINGCQTTNAVVEVYKDIIRTEGKTLDDIKLEGWVTFNIIDVSSNSEVEVSEITNASNLQNKINSTELSNSMNPTAHEVRNILINEFGHYIDVKRYQTAADPSTPKEIINNYKSQVYKGEWCIGGIIACIYGRVDFAAFQKHISCFGGTYGSKALSLITGYHYIGDFGWYLERVRQKTMKVSRKTLDARSYSSTLQILSIYFNICVSLYRKFRKDKKLISDLDKALVGGKDERDRYITKDFYEFF